MKYTALFIVLLFTAAFRLSGIAQIELPEDKVKWKFRTEQKGCEATVIAEVTIVPHWHINSIILPKGTFGYATKFELAKSPDYQLVGGVSEPKPIQRHDEEADEDLSYHEGKIVFRQKIKVMSLKDFVLKGNYSFQPCDESHCLAPYDGTFSLKIAGCAQESGNVEQGNPAETPVAETPPSKRTDTNVSAKKTEDKIAGKSHKKEADRSLWVTFLLSFFSGFAALMTPCVFPMIPMTVSFFTKQSKTKAKGIRNALIYGGSIIVIYIVLGSVVTGMFGADVLNNMSTNPTFNFIFFLLLVVFAISFMGAFEIRIPNAWINKADRASDRGGMVGIFFMALVLALVSFSCTGPIVGGLLVESAIKGGIAPIVGMFGFSLALALPFAIFAAFPGWLNSLPKSGGWLNTVKVVLGILELALAFKFLSNADLSLQLHYLERETFLAIWIAIFGLLALYLFGFITLPHDDKVERLSVGRTLMGTFVFAFVIYMIPGMWGAPLKLISAFPPPSSYSESPRGFGSGAGGGHAEIEGTEIGPQGISVFHDFDKAKAYADQVGKPLFVDFTGHNCVNCRKMEETVWGEPGVIGHLRNDVVIVSLHVDERVELPKSEQKEVVVAGKKKTLVTTGDKWFAMEINRFNSASQPFYVMLDKNGEQLSNGSADYQNHRNPDDFKKWLTDGLKEYKKN